MTEVVPLRTPQAEQLWFRGHILPLDGLRGAGMLSVLLFHGFFNSNYVAAPGSLQGYCLRLTSLGAAGMMMFFSLSGFLITGILLDSVDKPHYWKNFYTRRALRILPAYLLMLIVLKAGHFISWRFVLASLLYIANMAWLVGTHAAEYGVMWSLAVEEQFYLIWPIVIRFLSRRKLLWFTVAGCVLTPFFRLILALIGIDNFFNTPSNLDCIVSGALLALLLRNGVIHRGNIRTIYRRLAVCSALVGLPFLLAVLIGFSSRSAVVFMSAFRQSPVLGLFAAFALWAVARHQRLPPGQKPAPGPLLRFFVFFGDISYSLYLVHHLLFNLYDRYTARSWLGGFNTSFSLLTVRLLIVSTVATAIAWLSRRYFEDLFLAQKNKLAPMPVYSAEFATAAPAVSSGRRGGMDGTDATPLAAAAPEASAPPQSPMHAAKRVQPL